MELEEMQEFWAQMSNKIEKQKKLTDKMIIMMTQEKYHRKLNKIAYPETIGAVMCYAVALLILINIGKLDNWYSLLCGVLCLLVLIVLPVLSLGMIHRIKNIDIAGNSYKDTLLEYAKRKRRFQKSMKWSYYLGFVLMFAIMPVTTKIIKGKDLFEGTKSIWPFAVAIPLAILFFVYFSKWAIKCYNNNINSAENLIKDIENNKS
ncbi:hypothetical protein U6A24_13720 [Aquimarina gracilis]|uniref:Uncharacterized protein n=1 Tax=Aquimarina gracilis TaxID=874422 RepID=A0ABU5ZXD2_9FLAO|nr:hypothetical protein [Aquimarina gracilis]MEB3346531.1 hypothetical protein [Aquimarina gracilis]